MLAKTKPSLTIKRRFKAAPAKVFAAWTQPAQVAKWFGPPGAYDVSAEVDLRVGGRYTIHSFCTQDGAPNQISGVYHEVVQDRRLVFTWSFHTAPEHESLVTIEFKPDGDGTLMTLTHEQFFDEPARDAHNKGWDAVLENLDAYLS
ncbi:SRPBCC domain-containing protein [Leptospira sp. severe_002]|uniref:SRPBCC family protein n=1 Tax=Leptospira sp. severe_002 TaxID=2838237 RepID=UPI001E2AF9F9|nr:SRPBCC domain-containing protein [Leptospira sp. severe_002]